jgi:hypothetical protein
MRNIALIVVGAALAVGAVGCGNSLEDACKNAAEMCDGIDEASCIEDQENATGDSKLTDEEIDCIAEAESCDAMKDC